MKGLLLFAGLLLPVWVRAQPAPVRVAAMLREVTVYRSAAELRQTAERAVPAGTTELRLTGLAPNLLPAGFQVEVTGGELLSSALARVYPAMTSSDSLAAAEKKLYRLQAEYEAASIEKEFLLSNKMMPTGEKEVWTAALQKGATYYRTRIYDLSLKLGALTRTLAVQTARVEQLRGRDDTRRPTTATGLEAIVRVQAAAAGTVRFSLRYVVPGSRWQPRHDVRLREPGQPVQVINRGLVRNESGLDWNGVRVTLLSADPSVGALRPALQPWTLRYSGEALNEGRLDDYAKRTPTPGQPGVYSADDRSGVRIGEDPAAEGDGSDDFSERFGVAEGVSVPTGSAQLVQLGTAEAPATLEYLTVPKLDPGVFLLAKVTNWEKLKLMADSANVYLRGAYLGQTYLNTRAFGDTLELALGRDPLVTVNRTKREDYNSKNALGRRTVKLSYEINVKNLHKTPINLRVLDQVPVPQEEEIQVEYTPAKGAVLDQESGRLTWQFALDPNESRKLPFSFEIEYPKNKKVNIHRNRRTYSPKFR